MHYCHFYLTSMPFGQDGITSIETHYILQDPGIESWWGEIFHTHPKLALRPTQPPIQQLPDFFPGNKAAGAWH